MNKCLSIFLSLIISILASPVFAQPTKSTLARDPCGSYQFNLTDLGVFNNARIYASGRGINKYGNVAGSSIALDFRKHAFFYTDQGHMIDPGIPYGYNEASD